MDDIKEIKRLLEQILAAQIVNIGMRAQDHGVKGENLVSTEYLADALALVCRATDELRGTVLAVRERAAALADDDDAPGSKANIEKARKMSMTQKRYDLGKGLF